MRKNSITGVPFAPIQFGNLEARIAQTRSEIDAAQQLRYRVFYEEMSAIPSEKAAEERKDSDRFDDICDHLLVIDKQRAGTADEGVGTYRLLRSSIANAHGGFYTSSEFGLDQTLDAILPPEGINETDFENYIDIDDNMRCTGLLSDKQIVSDVLKIKDKTDEKEQIEKTKLFCCDLQTINVPNHCNEVSSKEAFEYVNKLRVFFAQNKGKKWDLLQKLENEIVNMALNAKKENNMKDMFL